MQYVIWYWQLQCKNWGTPLSTLQVDPWILSQRKKKIVALDEWVLTWVDQTHVKRFEFCAFIRVLSLVHQAEDLALKSSKIIVNKTLLVVVSLKIVSKFDRIFWNSTVSWLGDLYTTPV